MTRTDCYELGRAPMFAWAALASALFGCSAQVDGEYQGEPLATIRGTVTSTRGALETDRPVVAAVVWYVKPEPREFEPRYVGDRISVRGSFPANFTLDIYNPPPKIAEMTLNHDFEQQGISLPAGTPLGIWIGFVAALDPSAKDDDVKKEDVLGIDTDHTLIYLEGSASIWDGMRPIDRDTAVLAHRFVLADGYNIQKTQGFHLAKFNPLRKLGLEKIYDCSWGDTCVHWSDPLRQAYLDWEFGRCKERLPQNPTCVAQAEPTPGEPAASSTCRAQFEAGAANSETCIEDATDWLNEDQSRVIPYIANPAGIADPITIEMGTTVYDRWD